MTRATDLDNAQDVMWAYKLAALGATPQLLERMTGYGARWARAVVKSQCGEQAPHRRKDDPAMWFEKDAERILHGTFVVTAYRCTDRLAHPAARLIDAHAAYREIHPDPILDINQCMEIIELSETGMAWQRTCGSCHARHWVVSEHYECPLCRRLQGMLCKGCDAILPEPNRLERRGRPRQYCGDCESNRSHRTSNTHRRRKQSVHSVER